MNQVQQLVYLIGLFRGLVSTVSAFHASTFVLQRSRHTRRISHEALNEESIGEHDRCSIMEGTSPKVMKLRKQLQAVWSDPVNTSPVILYGPKGSGKGALAHEIISRLPSWQTQSVHQLSLDDGIDFMETILGTHSHPGLLDDLSGQANTTLILKGFQSLHVGSKDEYDKRKVMDHAINTLVAGREYFSTFQNQTKPFLPRIIGCTQQGPEYFATGQVDSDGAIFIKVPSFESRAVDLKDIAKQKIRNTERHFDLKNVEMSKDAIQRLLDHQWKIDGDAELDSEIAQGLDRLASEMKCDPYTDNLLKSKHLLVDAYDERIRNRLLDNIPILRKIIKSPWIYYNTVRYIITPIFIAVLLVLFFGPQSREHNSALTIFWAGWWPGEMLVLPILGRVWCSICPFMAVGMLSQEAVTKLEINLRKWPKWGENIGPTFAFGLFFAILMWEELWDLPNNGVLSAYLLLLITAGAVMGSVTYEQRFWCRYLCPIGAMNKMFATLSMTEIRTWKANCEGCTSQTCKVGGSPTLDPSDAGARKGCPMGLKNNQLQNMGECAMCMSCVKNCEREAPELNFRPIGQDYGLPWLLPKLLQKRGDTLRISQIETNFWLGGIITILQGSVILHYLPKIIILLGMDPSFLTASPALTPSFALHAVLAACILAFPGTLSYIADAISIPFESSVNVWKRKLTPYPAENAAIINLYDTLTKENVSLSTIMSEWDLDNDGIVSSWEMEECFKKLQIPKHHYGLLLNVLIEDGGFSLSEMMDKIQNLYTDIMQAEIISPASKQNVMEKNTFETKFTFVDLFNKLDSNGNGFLSKDEFCTMSNLGYFKRPPSCDQFDNADIFQSGRLNFFEFMGIMRKNVRVEIQEIGYGYLPLAWGSLVAYWGSLGMQELGLLLLRVPDTFDWHISEETRTRIPQFVASLSAVHSVQSLIMITSLIGAVSLTQKLCDDNKVGFVRFLTHATVQVVGAAFILYLMLSQVSSSVSEYR